VRYARRIGARAVNAYFISFVENSRAYSWRCRQIDAVKCLARSACGDVRAGSSKEATVDFDEGVGARPPGPERRPSDAHPNAAAAEAGELLSAHADNDRRAALHPRLQAILRAAQHYGIELDPAEYRSTGGKAASTAPATNPAGDSETAPSAAALSLWAQNAGMWSRAVRIRWRHLLRLRDDGPVVLLFTDGGAGLLTGVDAEQNVVFLKHPDADSGTAAIPIDELRLCEVWAGEAV